MNLKMILKQFHKLQSKIISLVLNMKFFLFNRNYNLLNLKKRQTLKSLTLLFNVAITICLVFM